ncbi:uncharacterized protein LOC126741922 [Anthonomus grandis grandis]|uniref:uncharacterized protein LOC126741922 n=1 Tax=Anthonomus grandis grandis TaxID=2921223 RepID=UPI0021652366|nr:uncharacterized protein LOC126741922 [Anthonomus grandis grandis]
MSTVVNMLKITYFMILVHTISSSDGQQYSLSSKLCDTDLLKCLKVDLVNWLDKLCDSLPKNLTVTPGVSILTPYKPAESRSMQVNLEEQLIDPILTEKLTNFLKNHQISINLLSLAKEANEARGKEKKSSGMMMLMSGVMLSAMLGALSLSGIAVIAGKALLTGVVAFMISSIVGLRSLTGQDKHGSSL